MLRLLNHSERLKVGKRVVSEKKNQKKPSDGQTFRQTNYTKHQTEDKCTARVATNTRYPWSTSEGLTVVQGTNSRRRCSTALLPETSLVFIVHLLLHLIQHLLHPLQLQARRKKSLVKISTLLYINPDRLKLDYTVSRH